MSDRDPCESLEDPIDDLLSAIKTFREVALKRIDTDSWEENHIDKIDKLSSELMSYETRLLRLKNETW